jgi:nicotinamidase-related amidase
MMLCRARFVAFFAPLALGAPSWFDQTQYPGALGDLLPSEREARREVDPGFEGGARAVGSANTDFGSLVLKHGGEPNNHMRTVTMPSELEQMSGQHILNATPINISGASVLRTDHGLMPASLSSVAEVAWKLEDRPRRLALLVIEMMEEYRPILGHLVPQIQPLVSEFRSQGMPVFFTNWAHRPGDGLYSAVDRANGPRGLASKTNFQYLYEDRGLYPMQELMPTDDEVQKGHYIKTIHLDKFADLDSSGRSILAEKLHEYGVDTLVITGGMTDACVISTGLDAVDQKNLDVLLVSDGIDTSTPHHLRVLRAFELLFQEQKAGKLLDYLQMHSGDRSFILPPMQKLKGFLAKFEANSLLRSSNFAEFNGPSMVAGLAVGLVVANVASRLRSLIAAHVGARSNVDPKTPGYNELGELYFV